MFVEVLKRCFHTMSEIAGAVYRKVNHLIYAGVRQSKTLLASMMGQEVRALGRNRIGICSGEVVLVSIGALNGDPWGVAT